MTAEVIKKSAVNHLFSKYPDKFERIEKNDVETVLPKKIFMITNPFMPIINNGIDSTYVLPIRYLGYGNFNDVQYSCECVGIKISGGKECPDEEYIKSYHKIEDILTNVYNVSDWETVGCDEDLLRTIGTVWEERRDRYYPIVLDEGKNLMINVNIEDPKIKDLMNYKLRFIDSLKEEALKMKRPKKVGDCQYKFLGSIDRKVAFDVAVDRQDYTCIGCGYRPKNVDKTFGEYEKEEGRILEPHRVVHGCFLGDYDRYNVVILCEKCHNLEYKYFKVYWNRFFEDGKLLEWSKLIEESFEFFKEYLVWLYLTVR